MTKLSGAHLTRVIWVLITVSVSLTTYALQDQEKFRSLLPESIARTYAIGKIMPIYPEEALQSAISGRVHVKLQVSPQGRVLRIKAKPSTNALLVKAVSDAVKQWKFKSWPGPDGLPQGVLTRLMFQFSLEDGKPGVSLYTPKPDKRIDECLGCSNSAREMREWREWEEVWSSVDAEK